MGRVSPLVGPAVAAPEPGRGAARPGCGRGAEGALVAFGAMRTPRALLAGLVVVAVATLFAACGGASAPATPSDPVLAEGQTIYNQKCASCHGTGGNGGMGPKLAGVVANRYPDIEDQKAVIANGAGSMPGFGGPATARLSDDEITAVARYEREVLGSK